MGFDTARFNGEVDEELICPICTGVLEDPVQVALFFHKDSWILNNFFQFY